MKSEGVQVFKDGGQGVAVEVADNLQGGVFLRCIYENDVSRLNTQFRDRMVRFVDRSHSLLRGLW